MTAATRIDGRADRVGVLTCRRTLDTRRRLVLGMMVASGFSALGYQIVWTQQSAIWLGHEAVAVLAVVAAFFGGLALGALLLGARIERSRQPARWYAACEALIGLWALALAVLLAPVSGWFLDIIGAQPSPARHWSVAFLGTFVLLLPATAAMGATLPAMERVLSQLQQRGASIAMLYAGNTFGAVAGVLGAAFWLVPRFGLIETACACALLNLLCAAAALLLSAPQPPTATASTPAVGRAILLRLAGTGLLGIGYEVLVVRVLGQVAENTVYTFAMLLAVYLVGTALGAAAYARWSVDGREPAQWGDRLLRLLAGACLLGTWGLAYSAALKSALLQAMGPGLASELAVEAALATVAFLPATVLMGALFSHLATHARATGVGFGRALGVNTLAAAAAPALFGAWLLPWLGAQAALLLVVAGYLALVSFRAWIAPAQWAAVWGLIAIALWAPSLAIVDVPAGGRIVSHAEGTMAAVSIVEDARGVASLHINNRQQEGSSATRYADSRQALLPVLLHPAPRRALFLGLGTGVTAWSAAQDPALRVDVVELLPEVIAAAAFFTGKRAGFAPGLHPNVMRADARRFVRATRERYELIVSDNFHPARSGSASLYTAEHFQAVRERLAPGGLFCQWLPLHQLDLATLRSIVRTFVSVYPHAWAMLATNSLDTPVVGLVADRDRDGFDARQVRERLHAAALAQHLAVSGIDDELALLGSFIAGPHGLARFSAGAPLNTDNHPVVAYLAPRLGYAVGSAPRDRLIALLQQLQISPDDLLPAPRDAALAARLAAYWQARDRYIAVGRDVRPTSDVLGMLAQVREPLLSVLRISPDFRPAYDPLLLMATSLARSDAGAARALLLELQRAQPAREEASRALQRLADNRAAGGPGMPRDAQRSVE